MFLKWGRFFSEAVKLFHLWPTVFDDVCDNIVSENVLSKPIVSYRHFLYHIYCY